MLFKRNISNSDQGGTIMKKKFSALLALMLCALLVLTIIF